LAQGAFQTPGSHQHIFLAPCKSFSNPSVMRPDMNSPPDGGKGNMPSYTGWPPMLVQGQAQWSAWCPPAPQPNAVLLPAMPGSYPQYVLWGVPCTGAGCPPAAWSGFTPNSVPVDQVRVPVLPCMPAACGPVPTSVAVTLTGCHSGVEGKGRLVQQEQFMDAAAGRPPATNACACAVDAGEPWLEDQVSAATSPHGSSTCSTAPTPYRRHKPRPAPAERRAIAAQHKLMDTRVRLLLEEKDVLDRQMQAGGDASVAAVARMQGAVWRLSTDKEGCRMVQLAIETAKGPQREMLCEELQGHVREAMGSPHANYVLQKVAAVMPIELAGFIAHELSGIAVDACKHRFGCRIVCRLTEQFSTASSVQRLLEEAMGGITELLTHSFGHHVVHAILEHGRSKHKRIIARELVQDVVNIATSKSGSTVIEKALVHCSAQDVNMLVKAVLNSDLIALAQTQFGIYVVRALTLTSDSIADFVVQCLQSASEDVQANRYYQKLLDLLREDQYEGDMQ